MSQSIFSALTIPFSQSNHASVFFAHLQNTLQQVNITQQNTTQFTKIDHVLFDIYSEHKKLESEYDLVSNSFKQMMGEFSKMMNEFKADREQLLKVTKDRENLLEKLKESTNGSIELVQENDRLQEYSNKILELNKLLSEKNDVLEEQIENRKVQDIGLESFNRIREQYDRLTTSNSDIRKELLKITEETEYYSRASIPLQIIYLAFQQNEKIKSEIWETAVSKNESQFSDLEYIKQKFYDFDFSKIIKK